MRYINKSNIIFARIKPPYKSDGTNLTWDLSESHGWQAVFYVVSSGERNESVVVDRNNEKECEELISKLDLIRID